MDVVVGTPGRVKDFLEKGVLKMENLKFRVLDECDEMLNMGFADDVEKIIGAIPDPSKVQTLLFSATLVRRSARVVAPSRVDLLQGSCRELRAQVRDGSVFFLT